LLKFDVFVPYGSPEAMQWLKPTFFKMADDLKLCVFKSLQLSHRSFNFTHIWYRVFTVKRVMWHLFKVIRSDRAQLKMWQIFHLYSEKNT